MSESFLYLITTGHKTGREHRIEIWYVEHEAHYYIISEQRYEAHWVQNIMANETVRFSIGTPDNPESLLPLMNGVGRLMPPEEQPELLATISQMMNAKYQWNDGLIIQIEPSSS